MQRRAIISITALVIVALGAQAAMAGNCVNLMARSSEKDWVCTVKSDFGTQFKDCFTFIKDNRDHFFFNVQSLTPFFVSGACNDEGSFLNPRFGRSEQWMSTFGFFDAPLSITFAGGTRVVSKPAQTSGRASNEFGDRFVFRCKFDNRNVCPLVAGPTPSSPMQSKWVNPKHR